MNYKRLQDDTTNTKQLKYDENKEYLDMFCLTFRMIPLIRSFTTVERYQYHLHVKDIFMKFQTTHPFSNFTVEEGLQLIEDMQAEVPGSISLFIKRIFPFRILKDSFAELNSSLLFLNSDEDRTYS